MQPFRRCLFLGAVTLWMFAGCASVREQINWEFKAEQSDLEPHEQRREELEHLARPR